MKPTLELNNLYNLDCMEGMPEIPDKYFDLAIVDAQYGIKEGRKKRRNTTAKQKNGSILSVPENCYTPGDWDDAPPPQKYFDELFRVSKKQIIFGENHFSFTQKASSSGRIIWDKVNTGDFSDAEIAWTNCISSTRIIAYMWNGMMQGKSITDGRVPQGNKALNEKRIHQTQKPVIVYKKLLTDYAKPGYKVLDTHNGSGSFVIACEEMDIDYMAFEILKKHYDDAQKRIQEYKSQLKIQFA